MAIPLLWPYNIIRETRLEKQCDIKSVRKCREETRLALLQSRGKKILDCFQTVRQSYLINLYRMLCVVFIAFVACDIACITFVACNIAFVTFVA